MVGLNSTELAAIQYCGLAGVTRECLDSIKRFIHFGDIIHDAKLLTCRDDGTYHAFILSINHEETIAIKSGFASGYTGTGARGLAIALQLLMRHDVDINEYEVTAEFIERLDNSCLLQADFDWLENARSIKPDRYTDYIVNLNPNVLPHLYDHEELRGEFPVSMPFSLIDVRLIDLALDFFESPDARLLTAFRRLEDIVRERIKAKGKIGARLFAEAFQSEKSILYWQDEDNGEHAAKASMFSAIYGAYRNPRAHQEAVSQEEAYLREFLLINELYLLEKIAVERPVAVDA